ncbi:MAG TPA: hypothetical protein PKE45_24955 [Caldilineaceae bacterium]|nr:hypothetical protein [Caldilineaceae bacterium]
MSVTTAGARPVARSLGLSPAAVRKQRPLWGDAWVQFRRNKLSILGMIILAALVIGVLVGPLVYKTDPKYIDFSIAAAPPSAEHPFGTDDLGRDTLARNLYGGRI